MATDGAEFQNNIPIFQSKKNKEEVVMNAENNYQDNIIYLINLKQNNSANSDKVDFLPELSHGHHKDVSSKVGHGPEYPIDSLREGVPDSVYRIKKKVSSFIKNENSSMVRNIIDDDDIFSNLSNEYILILSELLAEDKISGQKYIAKIIDNSDDELTLGMVKNKAIYNFLNRENKIKLIKKLLKNPWLPKEETKLILDIIGKNDRKILDNISFQNNPVIQEKDNSDNNYREHNSESNDETQFIKKRNKYDDFLTEF